ncbi:two-component system sensor histidine kinase NtrB [Thiovibrio frasassiensis]|jgi:two-component system sensor histidine kinase PilS (NtrC family)|uniref:histidine kinase n=1 Tax=Thiovibrio frasassiensis TaxID=2984131 RepID=A0A9X4RMA6_9BACT|nr:ATP-binding protein [Thiovibrio frasassiensis]MDG4476574.1 ATP-binding protein [Thiovibrio frasassiensis]
MRLSSFCPHTGSPAANDHLKKQIQWLLFFRVLFLSLMLGISILLQTKAPSIFLPPLHYIAYFIAGLYLFTILSALVVRIIHCYSRFGYLQITLDTLLVTLLVFSTGGSQSVFTVVYFFPIVMGAFMLFRRGSLLFASLSTLLFGTLLLVEYGGYASRFVPSYSGQLANFQMLLHYFTIYSLTFFLVAILSSMLSTRLQKTEAELFQTASDYDRLSFLYKQIFDDINTGIITVDAENRVTSFNRAAELITGYRADEIIARELAQAFPGMKTNLLQDERRHMATIPRKSGESIPVGYSCSRLTAHDDKENGNVYTLQDLSQIKKMEAQVQQAEKMATIGEMAAGIAHELRNPLAAISGAVQLLDREARETSINKRLFSIIMRESDRLDATINEFLLFSKPVNPEKEWFSLRALALEAVETLGQDSDWNPALTIELQITPELECWGDPQLVRQVLLNLITNGANACRNIEQGRIVLRAEETSAGEQEEAQEGAIVFEISDNGHGIPQSIRERIFEPFFTTRETGTGLGLAIVHQIVHSHGGEISVRDCLPQGTVFSVRLPLP